MTFSNNFEAILEVHGQLGFIDLIKVSGKQLPLIAIYAEPFCSAPIYLNKGLLNLLHPKPVISYVGNSQEYFQAFFSIPDFGDVAIEIAARPSDGRTARNMFFPCWVSAWNDVTRQGVGLGFLDVQRTSKTFQELEVFLENNSKFLQAFPHLKK